jgi:hypothetical protein
MAERRRRKGVAKRMLTAAIAAGLQADDDAAARDVRLWADIELNQVLAETLVVALRPSAQRCHVVVTGALLIPRRVREPREVHLPPLTAELQPMRKESLEIPIPPAVRASATRALRRGQVVTARLELRATDARGRGVSVDRVIVLSLAR